MHFGAYPSFRPTISLRVNARQLCPTLFNTAACERSSKRQVHTQHYRTGKFGDCEIHRKVDFFGRLLKTGVSYFLSFFFNSNKVHE